MDVDQLKSSDWVDGEDEDFPLVGTSQKSFFEKFKKPILVVLTLTLVAGVIVVIALTRNLAVNPSSVAASDEPTNNTDYQARVDWVLKTTALTDTHNDLPWEIRSRYPNIDLEKNQQQTTLETDLVRAALGHLRMQFWSVWVPCGDEESTQTVMQQIDLVRRLGQKYPQSMAVVETANDARDALANGKLASFIGMEGGHPMNNSLSLLRQFRDVGVKYMTLTHTCSTGFAESSVNERLVGLERRPPYADVVGLNKFGERVVLEMNRVGMIIDLSHVSTAVMKKTLQISKAPVIFSHSSARGICNVTRNVPDEVLPLVKENGGVIQVNFYCGFVSMQANALENEISLVAQGNDTLFYELWMQRRAETDCNVAKVVDHIMYLVDKIGAEHVGIGSDFDGTGRIMPIGLEDVSKYPVLIEEMLRRGLSNKQVKQIAGDNILRVLDAVEAVEKAMSDEPADQTQYSGRYDAPEVHAARHGAVAADAQVCSEVGAWLLRDGGHAVDAAVGTALCLGVVHPLSSGIGGGGFMTVYDKATKQALAFNFREMAPAAANLTMFVGTGWSSTKGSKAFAVPGEVRGMYLAHQMFGKLDWSKVVTPAASLASNGFVVDHILAQALGWEAPLLNQPEYKSFWQVYAPNGVIAQEGDKLRNIALGRTLSAIAKFGDYGLYGGEIADDLISDLKAAGGLITSMDLKSYYATVEKAQKTTFRGSTVYTTHPPSAGGALVGAMLNILDLYPATKGNVGRNATGLEYHRAVESMKFAFADHGELGDPEFANLTGIYPEMIGEAHAKACKARLNDSQTYPPAHYNVSNSFAIDHGTSHLSVIDGQGSAVGMTTTVNLLFGSMILSAKTGIVMNDQMDDFSVDPHKPNAFGLMPHPANYVAARKRPLSSMAPTVVLHADSDDAWLAVGASGGPTIPTSTVQVITDVVDRGATALEAVSRPRLHHQLMPNVVVTESGFDAQVIAFLRERGHNVTTQTGRLGDGQKLGVVQLVTRDRDGSLHAASDPRKGGKPKQFK